MTIQLLCPDLVREIPQLKTYTYPWQAVAHASELIQALMPKLGEDYSIKDGVAIHATARVDPTATIHAPAIIGPDCFVSGHTLLRGGVYIGASSSVGPGCEIKQSLIGSDTALAHFNFVGNSIIGSRVNFEAGALTANHYNERDDKTIYALWGGKTIETDTIKFGACIGDDSKIGGNAVTSPGTILGRNAIVGRLELIAQIP